MDAYSRENYKRFNVLEVLSQEVEAYDHVGFHMPV